MYEYIFPGLALDEAKAFAGVEPLDCSLFFAHFVILFSLKKLFGAPLTEEIGCKKNDSLRSGFVSTNPETGLRPSSAALLCFRCAGTKKGREFDPRPLHNQRRYKSNKRKSTIPVAGPESNKFLRVGCELYFQPVLKNAWVQPGFFP